MPKSPNDGRPALVWFRTDLRLGDHPALHAAAQTGRPLLCVYLHDEESPGLRPLGGASRWWLHGSLVSLAARVEAIGGRLDIHRGAAARVLPAVAAVADVCACFWSRRYGAAERAVDSAVEAALAAAGITVETFNGTLLHEADEVRAKAGGLFRVFTPYRKAALALGAPAAPLPAPEKLRAAPVSETGSSTSIAALRLLPTAPDWAGGLRETWTPGEPEAMRLLDSFLEGGLARYGEDRNRPALRGTSGLSPHLRFGEVSPRRVVARSRHAAAGGRAAAPGAEKFESEVVWRDFAYNLLAQHPDLATAAVQPQFRDFPYVEQPGPAFAAWSEGRTGYPIVDAGMRQLWRTGVMHNRVRLIAASFLVKHLLVDWRLGEAFFWDTLCDADPANNPVNWQWVAGAGADPSPYFRIFNPITQGERFDPDGDYIRTHVPELGRLPPKWINRPWEAPADVLKKGGVVLGRTYPHPIVEHEPARVRALAALSTMRERNAVASPPSQ